jgi:hypothetical protein
VIISGHPGIRGSAHVHEGSYSKFCSLKMLAFVKKIGSRLRSHGPGYFSLLARTEIASPRFRTTQLFRNGVICIGDLFGKRVSTADSWSDKCLQFVYDLGVSPVTFDFATYLAAAEVERRLRGLDGINVIFVMDPQRGVREEKPDYESVVNKDARLWRIRQMLLPMLAFLPSVRNFALCASRDEARAFVTADPGRLYPRDYRLFLPRSPLNRIIHEHAGRGVAIWPMFRASEHGRRLVGEFLAREAKGRKPLVITLRNYSYMPERNSRNADWLAFADSLDRERYAPIFVQDTETVMQPMPADFSRHIVFGAASVNLELRMALYEAAWLNMAVMSGPMELCWYNEQARYLVFIALGSIGAETEAALIRNGQRLGCDLDFASPYQRIVWARDEVSTLKREFIAMKALLDAQR